MSQTGGLSSKKEVSPRTSISANPRGTTQLITTYLRRICSTTIATMSTATAVIPIAAITPESDQDTTSRHTPSTHSYGSLMITFPTPSVVRGSIIKKEVSPRIRRPQGNKPYLIIIIIICLLQHAHDVHLLQEDINIRGKVIFCLLNNDVDPP